MRNISTKLLISIGMATIFFAIFFLYQTYSLTNRRVREVVEQQASMALKFDLAIRKYIAENVRPVMSELLGPEEFMPETMSTSYVARTIFEDVRKEFPNYIIKFASDNPRNPVNQAGLEELKIIEYFNNNPHVKRWEGEISIDGEPYVAKFSPMRMEESCLPCHSDPKYAPASLLKRYGSTAGFHRPLGQVIGMDTIAIPMVKIAEQLWSKSMQTFLVGGLGLLLFFLTVIFTTRFIITNRLTIISNHFVNAAQQEDYSKINPIEVKGKDEIFDLAFSFNTLSDKLKSFYSSLDSQVKERTRELKDTNAQLKQEIDERKQAEEKNKASLKEKEALLSEVHHRVKNNMQVIISLLKLQADKIEDKKYADMLKESQNRILSMALLHEQLYMSKDFANIDFGEYVKSLVNSLFVTYGIDTNKVKLNIDIKDVVFDIENAIPCGLIINELVSNSLKHAFPQHKEGNIGIVLRATNEDELELTVSDDGVCIPEDLDIRDTESMGLHIVRMLAEQTLEGKMDLDRTEGTHFHFLLKRSKYKPRI